MTIVFIGEGERDVGSHVDDGDLPLLLRRIVGKRFAYAPYSLAQFRAENRPARPTRFGHPLRQLRNVITALLERPPTAIVAVLDVRPHEHAEYVDEIRQRVHGDETIRMAAIPIVVGLAVHEIEAWMLADPAARRAAFARAHDRQLDGAIEGIVDPRSLWAKLCGEAAAAGGTAELHERRAAAWAELDPEVVARACPTGFAPFLQALRRDILPLLRR